jgi:hypothetical protein
MKQDKPKPTKAKAVPMKPFKAWVCVNLKTGHRATRVIDNRSVWFARSQHRLARVLVTEVER